MFRKSILAAALGCLFLGPAQAQQQYATGGKARSVLWGTSATEGDTKVAVDSLGKLLFAPVSSAVTEGAVTVTASSAQVLASGTRRYLYLENLSATATIACRFGATAALNTAGSWSLVPYASKVWESSYVPSDAINCIGSTSSVPLTVLSK